MKYSFIHNKKRAIKLPYLCSILVLLCIATIGFGRGKDSSGVGLAFHQLHAAMLKPDAQMLQRVTHRQLSYGHSSGVIDNQQQFVEKLVTGKSVFKAITTDDIVYTPSRNVVLVRYRLRAETNDGGKPGQIDLQVLLVFQRHKQGWLLLARQAVKPPATT